MSPWWPGIAGGLTWPCMGWFGKVGEGDDGKRVNTNVRVPAVEAQHVVCCIRHECFA